MSSHKFQLELATRAEADIWKILAYTEKMWGEKQADEYAALLHKTLSNIEQNPKIGNEKPDLKNGIFCFGAGRHLIFYRIDGSTVYVLRVLHDSMDYVHHLSGETSH